MGFSPFVGFSVDGEPWIGCFGSGVLCCCVLFLGGSAKTCSRIAKTCPRQLEINVRPLNNGSSIIRKEAMKKGLRDPGGNIDLIYSVCAPTPRLFSAAFKKGINN